MWLVCVSRVRVKVVFLFLVRFLLLNSWVFLMIVWWGCDCVFMRIVVFLLFWKYVWMLLVGEKSWLVWIELILVNLGRLYLGVILDSVFVVFLLIFRVFSRCVLVERKMMCFVGFISVFRVLLVSVYGFVIMSVVF